VRKIGPLVYGVISQIIGLGSLVYFGFWVYRAGVPKTVDSGNPGNPAVAFAVDTFLLAFFCFMHSILARSSVKSWMRRYVPHLYERATYCLFFGLLLLATCFAWRPLPAVVWHITSPGPVAAFVTIFALGWIVHFGSLFWMGYAEFFGLRQVWLAARGEEYHPPAPMTRRDFAISHILLIVSLMWIPFFTPTMSVGQLYFASFFALYDILGAFLSARDLSDVPAPVADDTVVRSEALQHP
jgi:protein-S-isoprenylcysteine O-methyltransferase Ste14